MEEWELVTENKQNLLEEGGRVCRWKEGEFAGGRESLQEEGGRVSAGGRRESLQEEGGRASRRMQGDPVGRGRACNRKQAEFAGGMWESLLKEKGEVCKRKHEEDKREAEFP